MFLRQFSFYQLLIWFFLVPIRNKRKLLLPPSPLEGPFTSSQAFDSDVMWCAVGDIRWRFVTTMIGGSTRVTAAAAAAAAGRRPCPPIWPPALRSRSVLASRRRRHGMISPTSGVVFLAAAAATWRTARRRPRRPRTIGTSCARRRLPWPSGWWWAAWGTTRRTARRVRWHRSLVPTTFYSDRTGPAPRTSRSEDEKIRGHKQAWVGT